MMNPQQEEGDDDQEKSPEPAKSDSRKLKRG